MIETSLSSPSPQVGVTTQGGSLLLWQSVRAFLAWLDANGYESYDPYDIWGTRYGMFARRVFYKNSRLGLPLVAPILLLETLCPRARALLVAKKRYATADAQLLLAFLNLHKLTGDQAYLEKAKSLGNDLLSYSIPGFSGLCWGYPFDWQHVGGVAPKGTPFITTTPYCFEAFLRLFDETGTPRYLELARSAASFVYNDLKDYPIDEESASSGYCPFHRSTVVNASAYRAMVLFEADRRFDLPGYAEKAWGNLRFILRCQQDDGSWLYSADNPREAFVDHFHTCFVLKNLWKLNRCIQSAAVADAIQKGFDFYKSSLFGPNGLPISFAVKPRQQIVRLEMYDVAEAITLGCLLRDDIPDAFAIAQKLSRLVCDQLQLSDGHFVTRIYIGGVKHQFPFLRWPQAQLFYALTNVLKSLHEKPAFIPKTLTSDRLEQHDA